jgi:rhamnosyltransferase
VDAPPEKKLIVIAHFDAAGILSKDWLTFLALLKSEAFADLVLVSTGLNAQRYTEQLAGVRVIVRDNVGYDFYSWRQGILESSLERYDELTLINSSFFVPDAQKFIAVLRQPMPSGAQIRGLTVSWQWEFHAQSYFLQFSREVVGSASFQSFWRDMQPISERNDVVLNYEIGLSKALGKEFRIESIFPVGPYEKFLLLRRGLKDPSWVNAATLDRGYEQFKSAFNPSLMLWDALLFRYGIVKKQFVTQNPFNWPIDELRNFVGGCVIA